MNRYLCCENTALPVGSDLQRWHATSSDLWCVYVPRNQRTFHDERSALARSCCEPHAMGDSARARRTGRSLVAVPGRDLASQVAGRPRDGHRHRRRNHRRATGPSHIRCAGDALDRLERHAGRRSIDGHDQRFVVGRSAPKLRHPRTLRATRRHSRRTEVRRGPRAVRWLFHTRHECDRPIHAACGSCREPIHTSRFDTAHHRDGCRW